MNEIEEHNFDINLLNRTEPSVKIGDLCRIAEILSEIGQSTRWQLWIRVCVFFCNCELSNLCTAFARTTNRQPIDNRKFRFLIISWKVWFAQPNIQRWFCLPLHCALNWCRWPISVEHIRSMPISMENDANFVFEYFIHCSLSRFLFSSFLFFRYRVLLDSVLTNPENELIETLKLFIEASKWFPFSISLFPFTAVTIHVHDWYSTCSCQRACQFGDFASTVDRCWYPIGPVTWSGLKIDFTFRSGQSTAACHFVRRTGGQHSTAFGTDLRTRRELAWGGQRTGGHSIGNWSKVSKASNALETSISSTSLSLSDSTPLTISWRPTWKSLDCIWKMMIRCKRKCT